MKFYINVDMRKVPKEYREKTKKMLKELQKIRFSHIFIWGLDTDHEVASVASIDQRSVVILVRWLLERFPQEFHIALSTIYTHPEPLFQKPPEQSDVV